MKARNVVLALIGVAAFVFKRPYAGVGKQKEVHAPSKTRGASVTGQAHTVRNRSGKMRTIPCIIAFVLLSAMCSCRDNTEPVVDPAQRNIGEIEFHGEIYDFEFIECSVSGTDGGEQIYSLQISFTDEEGRSIGFGIQDSDNDPAELIVPGLHLATGQHRDGISNSMQPSSFTINYLGSECLSVFWEEVDLRDHAFSGRGYIEIRQRLDLACPDRIWIGGRYAHPGDPEYDDYYEKYCAPGYYYPAQRIWFTCENGSYRP
jgi:hypothetical protein